MKKILKTVAYFPLKIMSWALLSIGFLGTLLILVGSMGTEIGPVQFVFFVVLAWSPYGIIRLILEKLYPFERAKIGRSYRISSNYTASPSYSFHESPPSQQDKFLELAERQNEIKKQYIHRGEW